MRVDDAQSRRSRRGKGLATGRRTVRSMCNSRRDKNQSICTLLPSVRTHKAVNMRSLLRTSNGKLCKTGKNHVAKGEAWLGEVEERELSKNGMCALCMWSRCLLIARAEDGHCLEPEKTGIEGRSLPQINQFSRAILNTANLAMTLSISFSIGNRTP